MPQENQAPHRFPLGTVLFFCPKMPDDDKEQSFGVDEAKKYATGRGLTQEDIKIKREDIGVSVIQK